MVILTGNSDAIFIFNNINGIFKYNNCLYGICIHLFVCLPHFYVFI